MEKSKKNMSIRYPDSKSLSQSQKSLPKPEEALSSTTQTNQFSKPPELKIKEESNVTPKNLEDAPLLISANQPKLAIATQSNEAGLSSSSFNSVCFPLKE